MHRLSIAACAAAALCLAGSAGCCCCQRGFTLSGDWSLQMDRFPNDCAHGCAHGHCEHGHGMGHNPETPVAVSAAPPTSPQFHPLPTAPVGNVTAPHPAVPPGSVPALASAPATADQRPKQISVLKRNPPPPSESSSWMFVDRPGPSTEPANVAERRQLAAEGWTGVRRR